MRDAVYETTSIKIDAGDYRFTASTSKIIFAGFMSVYQNADDKQETDVISTSIRKGEVLKTDEFEKLSILHSHLLILQRLLLYVHLRNLVLDVQVLMLQQLLQLLQDVMLQGKRKIFMLQNWVK